ncbi:hypothetical protein [Kribbella jejuensis]|uniref:Mce-associated membrane protein n=1 Tax=Kribbella jejuensis TaxID=236068 RepID=A0A542ELT5_9ACTN|nr:hypothetical protein [Kribbella jejuensis]TQJ16307.1 hypothetical protein FB475_0400 [Kribbella jejuensis]
MRLRNVAVTASLLPVLLLQGCGTDAGMAAAAPAAHKATRAATTDAIGSDDPVLNAYYAYRVALDVMMRSGGGKTEQLESVMTPKMFQAISAQAKYFRTNKLHNTGLTKVVWAKRTLASNGVLVNACYDTTAARTVNARGRGVLPNTTPTRWLDQMRVVNQGSRWIVDGGTTTPTAC